MLRGFWSNDDGSALLEGAIVLPVLFALLFGVYEFSWFFYQQHLISTGLRDGARYLARSSTACDSGSPQWAARVENAAHLATSGSITGGVARVRGWSPAMVTLRCAEIDNAAGAYRGGAVISVVSLATRFVAPSLGFFRLLGLSPPVIAVMHAERMIGPG